MLLMNRRSFMQSSALAGAAGLTTAVLTPPALAVPPVGRLNQSVCYWTYQKFFTLDELCKEAVRIGLKGVDLVTPAQYATVKKYGLTPAMTASTTPNDIPVGLNRLENHDRVIASIKSDIVAAAAAKVPNVITFSGVRNGLPDAEGLENCVTGLNKVKAFAEQNGVTVNLELLNSKVDHKDYQADHSAWGIEMVKRVSSPRVKLLFDIYHMQIMEGDIIRTIQANIAWIGHFHTGGNPGRHEIGTKDELNYNAISNAIADTHYSGFVAHEFNPIGTPPVKGLEEAYAICTV
jgi:hydroxypyruvate isomerase